MCALLLRIPDFSVTVAVSAGFVAAGAFFVVFLFEKSAI
jgi:hypothetical protein